MRSLTSSICVYLCCTSKSRNTSVSQDMSNIKPCVFYFYHHPTHISLQTTRRKINNLSIILHNIFRLVKVDHPRCKRNQEEDEGHQVDLELDCERIFWRFYFNFLSQFWTSSLRRFWRIFLRLRHWRICRLIWNVVRCRLFIWRSVRSWIAVTLS